jgi:molybdopterin-guanine dinucleotide biosynthesis protein A
VSGEDRGPLGLVLCGGRSGRMGRDKALLPWAGSDLLGHAIARLAGVASDVVLLCGPARRYAERGLPVLPDRDEDGGPVAGLEAGLAHASGRAVVLLAVDLPLVPAALLRALVDGLDGRDAAVPVTPRGREPLCAAYGPACLGALRARVAAGERKMSAFWPDVRVREVGPAALAAFGDPETMFLNVNEPGDLERAASLSRP